MGVVVQIQELQSRGSCWTHPAGICSRRSPTAASPPSPSLDAHQTGPAELAAAVRVTAQTPGNSPPEHARKGIPCFITSSRLAPYLDHGMRSLCSPGFGFRIVQRVLRLFVQAHDYV
jgi:hypothetical protein